MGFPFRLCAALSLSPGLVLGCSCLAERLPCRVATGAAAMFVGRVDAMAAAGERHSRYTFAVERDIKGTAGRRVDVVAGDEESLCGVRFRQGATYLIYAWKDDQGQLRTQLCSGNKPLEAAGLDLRYFGDGEAIRRAAQHGMLYGVVTHRMRDLNSGPRVSWPVRGARVTVAQSALPVAETRTDEDGMYSFSQLPAGAYRVHVEGGAFWVQDTAPLVVMPGVCREQSFYDAGKAVLVGELRDAEGELDDSTDVVLMPADGSLREVPGESSELETETEGGKFRLEVPPGRYRLGFRELGYKEPVYYPGELDLRPERESAVEFRLPRRPVQRVAGVVVDELERPLTGARVSMRGEAPDGLVVSGTMTTGEDGGFTFEAMELDYEVAVRVAVCGETVVARGMAKRGQREGMRLKVGPGCSLPQ
ncbi:MAG: carboxypeptidase regulatory-like domain-containing protein [Bryobacterales bacterium]|nr:carboxypeptidase regulatory-like domain-containing protein [Bryobacterales bacterium]